MESREKVTASVEAIRASEPGLTVGELARHKALLNVLGTDDPGEGVARLSAAVDRLVQAERERDRFDAQELRAALGIGLPPLKNVTARRRAAKDLGLFFGEERSQYYAEKRAIPRLVDLLFEEAAEAKGATTDVDVFLEVAHRQIADPSLIAPSDDGGGQPNYDNASKPLERDRPEPAGLRAKMHAFYHQSLRGYLTTSSTPRPMSRRDKSIIIGYVVAAATIIVLMAIGVIPGFHHHTSSATIEHPNASVTGNPEKSAANKGGWGPGRSLYTMEHASLHPVINSITDLNNYGDERGFFVCHDLTDPSANGGGWGNTVAAEDQHTYKCQVLYDNDAASGFDHMASPSSAINPMAELQNTRARVQFPDRSTVSPVLWAFVSADNANPPAVWDAVTFTSTQPVTLTYVTGTARLLIGGGVTPNGGAQLDDAALTGNVGVLVGDHQDGVVDQNPGYIQFDVTATLG